MNKTCVLLLCSSAFLFACDSSNDAAEKAAVEEKIDESAVAVDETVAAAGEPAMEAATDAAAEPADADAAATTAGEMTAAAVDGESIYKSKCIACHGAGVAGAPKLGDKAAWAPRIAQGNAVLTQHAIDGFKGETGVMPAKGGFTNLSDEEIAATVEYMVSQSK